MTVPPPGEDLQRLFDGVREALTLVFEDFARQFRELHAALGGNEGIARLTAALQQHQTQAAAWEAEHPTLRYGESCHCLCPRWGHTGDCAGPAETFVVGQLMGEPVHIPMCPPCARYFDDTRQATR